MYIVLRKLGSVDTLHHSQPEQNRSWLLCFRKQGSVHALRHNLLEHSWTWMSCSRERGSVDTLHHNLPEHKKGKRKVQECHNHKPQPFPDPKRKRKPTNLNKHKPNKRTKSTKIGSLFPKRGNRNTKRTEKHMSRTKWHPEGHTTNRLVE